MRTLFTIALFPLLLTACLFPKSEVKDLSGFGRDEFGLTVDWLMEGQKRLEPTLKAIRILKPSGEIYRSDGAVTLPAAVPQSLILMGEFSEAQINDEVDFIRASVRLSGRKISIPAQLVSDDPFEGKRRLTFQVTGLNAAFRAEKSTQGLLQIEIFSRSKRVGILETGIRTPPSAVQVKAIENKEYEASEYLKPIIAGRQMNLVQVLQYENSENLPVQIQIPRRPRGRLTQWVNPITYSQSRCTYSLVNHAHDEILGAEIIVLPLNDRFITEAERSVRVTGIGENSTILPSGRTVEFGIYALGEGADRWMNRGPAKPETRVVSATSACVQRCVRHNCESKPGRDRFSSDSFSIRGCECEERVEEFKSVNITTGTERGTIKLNFLKEATQIPLRFADLAPNRDGEVRFISPLTEVTDVSWLQ